MSRKGLICMVRIYPFEDSGRRGDKQKIGLFRSGKRI